MAKKDDHELDDFDLDDFDWGDFDPSIDPLKDDRKPVAKLASGFLEGVKGSLMDSATQERLITAALPEGYTKALRKIEDIDRAGSDLYNTVAKELEPVNKVARQVLRSAGPKLKGMLPNKLADKLEKYLGDQEKQGVANSRESRESQMGLEMATIFKMQNQVETERAKQDTVEQRIRDVTAEDRHKSTFNAMDSIRGGIDRLVGYQDSVTAQFQRKSLELQYRQYFVAKDQLDSYRELTTKSIDAMQLIIKNTALPEAAKIRLGEASGQMLRDRMLGKVHDKVTDYSADFVNKLMGRVKNDAKSFLGGVTGQMSEAGQLGEMTEGMDKHQLAGNVAGSVFAEEAGRKISHFVRDKVLSKNKRIQTGGNLLSYGADNLPSLINKALRTDVGNDTRAGRIFNKLGGSSVQRYLRDAAPGPTLSGNIEQDGLDNLDRAVHINQHMRKSITEVIPGYLSRMLQELTIARTGDVGSSRMVYNFERNDFTTLKQTSKDAIRKILPVSAMETTNTGIDKIIDEIDHKGQLDEKERGELRRQILRNLSSGSDLALTDMMDSSQLHGVRDQETRDKISSIAQERFSLSGDMGSKQKTSALMANMSKDYNYMKSFTADPKQVIQSYMASGNIDALRELGLVRRVGFKEEIDHERLWDFYNKDSDLGDLLGNDQPGSGNPTNEKSKGRRKARRDRSAGGPIPPIQGDDLRIQPTANNASLDAIKEQLSGLTSEFDRVIAAIGENRITEEAQHATDFLSQILGVLQSGQFGGGGGEGGPLPGPGRRGLLRRTGGLAWKGIKGYGRAVGSFYKGAWNLGRSGIGGALGAAGSLLGGAGSLLFKTKDHIVDIYSKADRVNPILQASILKAGGYFDKATGRVIKTMDDIKGAVVDSEGNVVLTLEKIKGGLLTKDGKPLALRALKGIGGLISGYASGVMGIYGAAFGAAKWVASTALSAAGSTVSWLWNIGDIYVMGESTPRLLATILRAGGYFSKRTQKPVRKLSDIDGDIVDANGETVLTTAEMSKGLVDKHGKPLRSIAKKAASLIGKAALLPIKFAGQVYKGMFNMAKGGLKGIGGLLKGKFGQFGGGETTTMLGAIYSLLEERLPKAKRKLFGDTDGDGDRDGSAADLLSRKKKTKHRGARLVKDAKRKGIDVLEKLKGLLGMGGAAAGGGLGDLIPDLDIDLPGGRKRVPGGKPGLLRSALGKMKGLGKGALGLGGSAVARLAGTAAAGWVANGAIAAGSALAGLISAPVLLVGGAIALVGAGAYMGYKYYKKSKAYLTVLRMAQYGIDFDDSSDVEKVLQCEAVLEPFVEIKEGSGTLRKGKVDVAKLLEIFEVDMEDEDEVKPWLSWFNNRFKPVFFKHVSALQTLAPNVALSKIDTDMPAKLKLSFVDKVSFPKGSQSPYQYMDSPFGGEVDMDEEDIQDAFDTAREKATADGKESDQPTGPTVSEQIKSGLKTGLGIAAKAPLPGMALIGAALSVNEVLSGKTGSGNIITGTPMALSALFSGKLDGIACVRYRAYGLVEMDIDKVRLLGALENEVYERLTYDSTGLASFDSKDTEALLAEFAPRFGITMQPEDTANWYTWFNGRFLPVLTTFCTALRMIDKKLSPSNALLYLTSQQKLDVALAVRSATADMKGQRISIWLMRTSPWKDYVLNGDAVSTEPNIKALKEDIKNTTFEETKSTASKNLNRTIGVMDTVKQREQRDFSITPSVMAVHAQPGSSAAPGEIYARMAAGGNAMDIGSMMRTGPVSHPGKGTGGDINEVPTPAGSGTWEALRGTITKAAQLVGIDPSIAGIIAGIESGYRPTVKAGTSSATGLFQFINDTWKSMKSKYAAQFGINPNAPATDARANAILGAQYLKDNMQYLQSNLGRPVGATELYLAHFLGPAGAKKFLSADPNANAAQIMGSQVANANASIFMPNGRFATIAEVYNSFRNKIARHEKIVGVIGGGAAASTAQTTDPTASAAMASTAAVSAPATPSSAMPVGMMATDSMKSSTPASAAPTPSSFAPSMLMAKNTPAVNADNVIAASREAATTAAGYQQAQSVDLKAAQLDASASAVQVLSEMLRVETSMDGTLKDIRELLKANRSKGETIQAAPVAPAPLTATQQFASAKDAQSAPVGFKRKY